MIRAIDRFLDRVYMLNVDPCGSRFWRARRVLANCADTLGWLLLRYEGKTTRKEWHDGWFFDWRLDRKPGTLGYLSSLDYALRYTDFVPEPGSALTAQEQLDVWNAGFMDRYHARMDAAAAEARLKYPPRCSCGDVVDVWCRVHMEGSF